jgi:hypothetical protein
LKISGCDNSTPLKRISSRDSRKVSKKQRLMWVFSKAFRLSSHQTCSSILHSSLDLYRNI